MALQATAGVTTHFQPIPVLEHAIASDFMDAADTCTFPWAIPAAAGTTLIATSLTVLDSLHQKNLSAQTFRPHFPVPSSPSRHLQRAEDITLTIANVRRVDRVVRGAVVSWDAPLAVNASGVMLKDRGLEGHQFFCPQDLWSSARFTNGCRLQREQLGSVSTQKT